MSRNNKVSVAADRGFSNRWRQYFYPPGAKEMKFHIQTQQGWVCFDPDPNTGFNITHVARPTAQSGVWLQGEMDPSACTSDVAIVRALFGHRFWDVSTPRVWLYRLIAILALFGLLGLIGIFNVYTALMASVAVLAVKSPCTPKGCVMWLKLKGLGESKLATNKALDDDALQGIRAAMRDDPT